MVTRPDVAVLTARTIRAARIAVSLSETHPVPGTTPLRSADVLTALSNAIDAASPTATRDVPTVTTDVLSALLSDAWISHRDSLCAELAPLSGHSAEILSTRAVLRALLRRLDAKASSSSRAVRVRALCEELLSTIDAVERYSPSNLRVDLHPAWTERVQPISYDAMVAEHAVHGDSATLAWAIIGFESQRHINLVWHQANKLERLFPDRDAADMLALGWMGLRTALRLYDPTLGFSFSTYACTRITGAIRDGVRAENPVPKRLGTFGRKVAAAEESLAHALGRVPTLDEVAAHLGVTLDELRIIPRLQNAASIEELESHLSERGGSPSWLVDNTDPADLAVEAARRDAVETALSALDPQDAAAVRLLVMEGLRPAEAQSITGEAPRRLRSRRERALATLRDQLDFWQDGLPN